MFVLRIRTTWHKHDDSLPLELKFKDRNSIRNAKKNKTKLHILKSSQLNRMYCTNFNRSRSKLWECRMINWFRTHISANSNNTNPNFDQMYYNYVAKAFPNFINNNQLSLDDELIEERKSTVYTSLKHNLFSNYMYLLSLHRSIIIWNCLFKL